jgi:hypothetical protein
MPSSPEQRYLDLVKRALTFSLWPEPPVPIETFNDRRPVARRVLVRLATAALGRTRLRLATVRPVSERDRQEGRGWPAYGQTMIGRARLDHLQACVETVLAEGVPGDLLEAGVWRGGACILMRAVLAARDVRDRRVLVVDSFRGLPPPDPDRWPADRGDRLHRDRYLAVSREEVADAFRRYGLLDDQVVFLAGWFGETLPGAPIDHLAVLRLDADLYGSTTEALVHLYPKLSPGGFCIVDDYALAGCRQAVDDFRRDRGIAEPLQAIDWTGRYWRKR